MRELPRINLAQLPTPIEVLPNLTRLCGGPQIFIKRDDQTGLALGGNKARKLEFLLGEALSVGANTLITAGAAQSNHCRQTAAAAARCQMDCILVLLGDEPKTRSGNLLLDTMFGAHLKWVPKEQRDVELQIAFEEAKARGRKPFLIPYGGSTPTGATGYVFAMSEMVKQWDASRLNSPLPDWIIVASGSGGTQAGMVVGGREFQYQGRIVGISVEHSAELLTTIISRLVSETEANLEIDKPGIKAELMVSSDYLGGGYGVVGQPEMEAIHTFARAEGLLLDPVYTGRAAAGMLDMIRQGTIRTSESVLFWHTGGSPALFAGQYSELIARDQVSAAHGS